jgi:hypothetical protein
MIEHSPRIRILPSESIPSLQTSPPPVIQPLVGIQVKACVYQGPRTTRGRKGRFPPRVSYGTSKGLSRRSHLGNHFPCSISTVLANRQRRERPIRCLGPRTSECGCGTSRGTNNTTLQNPKPLEDTALRNLSLDWMGVGSSVGSEGPNLAGPYHEFATKHPVNYYRKHQSTYCMKLRGCMAPIPSMPTPPLHFQNWHHRCI